MRLLKDDGHGNLSLVEKYDSDIPNYAILSHTWGPDCEEVTFKDLMEGTGKNKTGYNKIKFCSKQAASDDLQYFWVDTCCIDKSSSTELTEAINSMFHWYQSASRCYVYLSDVSAAEHTGNAQSSPTIPDSTFRASRWFGRGWTLQELIAPASVEFFSREGDRLGSKQSLETDIHEITGIALEALRGGDLTVFTVEERLSWAERRETKRQEDKAYSLMGLFNIHMPLLYGEGGENAFLRLQEEISKSLIRKSNPHAGSAHFSQDHGLASSAPRQHAVGLNNDLQREFLYAFSSRYSEDKDFNASRVPDTCQWFLEDARFCDWRDSKRSCVLWVSAGPGCGKSVLSKCLVDEILVSRQAMASTICYFFFKDGQEGRQSGADALTAILHQLYSSNLQSPLINHALDKFKIHGKPLSGMFGELWTILTETAKDPAARELICVVDALDECEQGARQQLLDKLISSIPVVKYVPMPGLHLKFLITSRPYDSIQSRLDQLSNEISYIHFDADENYDLISQDINKVIDHHLPRVLGSKFNQDGQNRL